MGFPDLAFDQWLPICPAVAAVIVAVVTFARWRSDRSRVIVTASYAVGTQGVSFDAAPKYVVVHVVVKGPSALHFEDVGIVNHDRSTSSFLVWEIGAIADPGLPATIEPNHSLEVLLPIRDIKSAFAANPKKEPESVYARDTEKCHTRRVSRSTWKSWLANA